MSKRNLDDTITEGYDRMCSWIAANRAHFLPNSDIYKQAIEIYGVIQGEWVYINKNYWEMACKKIHYDSIGLMAALEVRGQVDCKSNKHSDRSYFVRKSINGLGILCAKFRLPDADEEESDEDD